MATCIILAGGLGTRLRSAVPNLPKCLAPVSGLPFLAWQLRSLSERGIDQFVLSLGHGADHVLEALSSTWAVGFSIRTVIEPTALGTGGAAKFAMDAFSIDEALIANGDTFLGGSLQDMLTPLRVSTDEHMRVSVVSVSNRGRFGGVELSSDGHITSFLEKGQVGYGDINAGLYRLHRVAFVGQSLDAFSLESQIMPRLVERGVLTAAHISGPFIDIGVPEDYRLFDLRALDYVRQG